jgi:sugar O-acyltransferase (sialic acid O-acetyltransferase NeuD family)
LTTNIAIYGAGGFGRETVEMVRQINKLQGEQWNVIGFFDDGVAAGTRVDQLPVLGGLKEANSLGDKLAIALTVADPAVRKKLCSQLTNTNLWYPTLIHPTAIHGSEYNKIDEGVLITAGVILTTHITIKRFSIINLTSTIGHDVSIGSYCTLMPACHISGNVKIHDEVLLGTGACVLQDLTIGSSARVGAGAVVTKNVGASTTVMGVPAREKKS